MEAVATPASLFCPERMKKTRRNEKRDIKMEEWGRLLCVNVR